MTHRATTKNSASVNYHGFLASGWATPELVGFRKRIWCRYENDQRGRVWVAEFAAQHLKPENVKDQLEIVDACLDAIEESDAFFLVDTGTYGTHLGIGSEMSQSSFLELELFQAALLAKPIHYMFVGRNSAKSPLCGLANSLSESLASYGEFSSLDEVEKYILIKIDSRKLRKSATSKSAIKRLGGCLARERQADLSNVKLFSEPQLLHGSVCGPFSGSPLALDLAEHYLNLADQQEQTNKILTRTWIAIRALMPAHYSATENNSVVALWDRALQLWSQATAWRGLHGHLWLGNVAALGSLAAMRQRKGLPLFDPSEAIKGDLYGAMASVYYSLSKNVDRSLSTFMLERAKAYVDIGLATREAQYQGTLFPLRGSINLRNQRYSKAAEDYQKALTLAEHHGNSDGQIGFLMTELGFAEVLMLKFTQGRRRIEDGLALMTPEVSNPGFRTRALRKHVLASISCLDISSARSSATKAMEIARENRLYDQIHPTIKFLSKKIKVKAD